MLTKSSARRFFLLGTMACSAAFVLLTLDTIKQVPKRTHEENLTPEVIRGKNLWDTSNCMGCHTIMGEGAYYAPELTKVFERRGETFIKSILRDPEAMYPGQRKMVNYHFSQQEIDDITAFLKWIGEVDLNGFPAKPDLGNVATAIHSTGSSPEGAVLPPVTFSQVCVACHAVGGAGGKVGPALDDIGLRKDAAYLSRWLTDPQAIKADSQMPKLPLSEKDIKDIVDYLMTLKNEVKK
ncbi:MAG: c-type cytochrome [Bdellovibrionaceae bacterium]|nr:c-type cytochrome [Pseudobdellovibrionaceae bacterium]